MDRDDVRRHVAAIFAMLLIGQTVAFGQFNYPSISRPDLRDPVFEQLQDDLATNRMALVAGGAYHLSFYRARASLFDDLFSFAARMNSGLSTIATVNRLTHPDDFDPNSELVVPNVPGLFLPLEPKSDFDRMLVASHTQDTTDGMQVIVHAQNREEYLFLPGAEFTPLDTAFFLGILFRFPLPDGYLTSLFGPRKDPFTGHITFHNGIDIAAKSGSPVLAARDGVVVSNETNDILGIHVVLQHAGGLRTVYGHLSRSDVVLNQRVNSGTILGAVGSTGRSTGPHLHFEIRTDDGARDPESFLRIP